MNRKTIVIVIIWALALGFLSFPCRSEAPTERVHRMLEKVMNIQSDPQLQGYQFKEQRRSAIKKVIAENFDFKAMAKQSLGQYWENLDSTEGEAFQAVFQDLFQDSYTRLVLDFLRREKILYIKEDINQDRALVKTIIIKTNDEIPVDYFLSRGGKEWLVHDVNIDGVSIVENYQKSFARVIKRESYKALLQKMYMQQKAIKKSS